MRHGDAVDRIGELGINFQSGAIFVDRLTIVAVKGEVQPLVVEIFLVCVVCHGFEDTSEDTSAHLLAGKIF